MLYFTFCFLIYQNHFNKRISSIDVKEKHSATFECELSFDNAPVAW